MRNKVGALFVRCTGVINVGSITSPKVKVSGKRIEASKRSTLVNWASSDEVPDLLRVYLTS